jgi:dihydrodiol dehydrogenase / D-xylose 1-dehydrogenase (NADP)
MNPEESFAGGKHRMVNMDLAGGALLDLGIYSLTWTFQCAYTTQPKEKRQKPITFGAIKPYAGTGADESTTIVTIFPRKGEDGGDIHTVATTSMRTNSDPTGDGKTGGPSIRIYGDKGEIQVYPPAFRPLNTKLILHDGTVEEKHWPMPGPGKNSGWKNGFGGNYNAEGEGHGMFFEADEAGYALLEGRLEGQYEDLDESITIMECMDEARKQGGLKYPDNIESTDYPLKL